MRFGCKSHFEVHPKIPTFHLYGILFTDTAWVRVGAYFTYGWRMPASANCERVSKYLYIVRLQINFDGMKSENEELYRQSS